MGQKRVRDKLKPDILIIYFSHKWETNDSKMLDQNQQQGSLGGFLQPCWVTPFLISIIKHFPRVSSTHATLMLGNKGSVQQGSVQQYICQCNQYIWFILSQLLTIHTVYCLSLLLIGFPDEWLKSKAACHIHSGEQYCLLYAALKGCSVT